MKLSDKFKNLGPSGLQRRVAPKVGDANSKPKLHTHDTPPVVSPAPATGATAKDRVAKWREAHPELYRERQAAYMRKRRAKLKEQGK